MFCLAHAWTLLLWHFPLYNPMHPHPACSRCPQSGKSASVYHASAYFPPSPPIKTLTSDVGPGSVMGDYGGPIAQDWMWHEEISRDAIENSNGANGFLARGPYRAITRWHVLTIFQPLNPSRPSSPSLPLFSPKADLLVLRETLSITLLQSEKSASFSLSLHQLLLIFQIFKKYQRVGQSLSQLHNI